VKRAVENTEVYQMTNEQSRELEYLRSFYELQKAIDRLTDPESRTILEEQKKELIKRLEPNR
jgi:hypothetical protein